jgi:putative tryptophan/tyrosine transport system substrate-binding protein
MSEQSKIENLKWVGLLAIVVTLAMCGAVAQAQQQEKVAKIGWLGFRSASGQAPGTQVFRREFRALGYVEGKNIAFEYRDAEGKLDRLPAVADELVRLKVDVIVTASTAGSLAAKNATRTIPIVFHNVSDPVATGLVDSLARPGGNITGFTVMSAVLAGKRLELLKETIPKLSRVALLWDPQSPGSGQQWKKANSRHEN